MLTPIFICKETISSFTLIVGIIRAGFVPFLISPRNSAPAIAHLLADTRANHVLVGHDQPIRDLASEAMNILQRDPKYSDLPALPEVSSIPLFDDIYRPMEEPFKLLPPMKPDPASPAVIVHSSGSFTCPSLQCGILLTTLIYNRTGSTSFPKPIPWTHLGLLQYGTVPCECFLLLYRLCQLRAPGTTLPDFGDRDLTGVRISCHV